MGRVVNLGATNIHVDGSLEVFPSGQVRFSVSGADTARLYVQQTAPNTKPVQQVGDFAGGALQMIQLDWLPQDLAAGITLTFTLRPVTQAIEGPVLVTVVAAPGMAVPLTPAGGSFDGPPWWSAAPGSGSGSGNKSTPPPATLWDTISASLAGFPGGAPVAIGAAGLVLVLALKKKG